MGFDVTGVTGFNANQYNALIEAGKSECVSQAGIDKSIQAAMAAGKNFEEAVRLTQAALPQLPPPMGDGVLFRSENGAIPSLGADIMALMVDSASEQRRQAAEQRAMKTELIIDEIHEQAQTMRDKAVAQLVMGIISGTVSIAQGVATVSVMSKGIDANKAKTGLERQTSDMALNTKTSAINSALGGVATTMNSISGAIGGFMDAEIKESEARIEGYRAVNDTLQALEQSLKELIQKALSVQDSIQQNVNQTRTKINA